MKLCALWFALFRGPSANFWLFVLFFVRKGQVARYSTKVRVGNIAQSLTSDSLVRMASRTSWMRSQMPAV